MSASTNNPLYSDPSFSSQATESEKKERLAFLQNQLLELEAESVQNNRILEEKLKIAEGWACEKHLFPFYQAAWTLFETGEFISNWHMEYLCEGLEAIYRGDVENLILMVPPGCSKSTITNVAFPCWSWLQDPSTRFITASVIEKLALRDAVRSRNIIESEWYQSYWGDKFQLSKIVNQKSRYENNHNGYRIATSIGGAGIGERFDIFLCLPYEELIFTDHGLVKIGKIVEEKLKVKVLTYNHDIQVLEFSEILRYEQNPFRFQLEVHFCDNTKITCTYDHLIYSPSRQGYIEAERLLAGDSVLSYQKTFKHVKALYKVPQRIQGLSVYNIATENHNYFAGEDPILLHNCDDPHKPTEITSDKAKDAVWDWWSGTMATRASSRARRVLIHQRLATDDLIGRVLESGEHWEVINLPMEHEASQKYFWLETNTLPNRDPRKNEGELLFPQIHTRAKVDRLKKLLGTYGASAQLQQRPVSLDGGIIKKKWLSNDYLLPPNRMLFFSRCQMIIGAWDLTFGATGGSYCVGEVWALKNGSEKYLIEEYRGKWEFSRQKHYIKQMLLDFPQIRILLIEKKASGEQMIDALKRELSAEFRHVNIVGVDVHKAKEIRLYMCLSDFEAGNIYLPAKAQHTWVEDYINELITFPVGKNDDRVDVTTMVLNYIAQNANILKSVILTDKDYQQIEEERAGHINKYANSIDVPASQIFGGASIREMNQIF